MGAQAITVQDIIVAIASFLLIYYFKELNDSVKKAVKSVEELNLRVGSIIVTTENNSAEIKTLREKSDKMSEDIIVLKSKGEEK